MDPFRMAATGGGYASVDESDISALRVRSRLLIGPSQPWCHVRDAVLSVRRQIAGSP